MGFCTCSYWYIFYLKCRVFFYSYIPPLQNWFFHFSFSSSFFLNIMSDSEFSKSSVKFCAFNAPDLAKGSVKPLSIWEGLFSPSPLAAPPWRQVLPSCVNECLESIYQRILFIKLLQFINRKHLTNSSRNDYLSGFMGVPHLVRLWLGLWIQIRINWKSSNVIGCLAASYTAKSNLWNFRKIGRREYYRIWIWNFRKTIRFKSYFPIFLNFQKSLFVVYRVLIAVKIWTKSAGCAWIDYAVQTGWMGR